MTANLLLVDDDTVSIRVLSRILQGQGELRFATNGDDALRLVQERPPDLILLDNEMPGKSGFEVCAILKADPAYADVPIIFITSHDDEAFEVAGLGLGAADFITKPVNPPLVLARVKTQLRLKALADELRRSAATDALTAVANRRRFDQVLEHEVLRARRASTALSLLMIDVDYFKLFNDHYGHPAGDECLCSVAQAMVRACQRPADVVSRYGGEEFALLLPETPLQGAEHIADVVLQGVAALQIAHAGSPLSQVSISIGCASWLAGAQPHPDAAGLVAGADHALYSAKEAGRARFHSIQLPH